MNATERKRLERYRKAAGLTRLDIWVPQKLFAKVREAIAKVLKGA